jgi:NAD(P)H-flavin reductase
VKGYGRLMAGAEQLPLVEARIQKVTQLSPKVLGLRVSAPQDFSWRAGQHLPVSGKAVGGEVGYYSIASAPAPGSPGEFELAVLAESLPVEGEVGVGMPLYLGRASGAMPLGRLEQATKVVLIGIGTGVAPLRATAQYLLSPQYHVSRQDLSAARPHVTLLQGARSRSECFFREEFEAFVGERFSYLPVYSQPEESDAVRVGRVQQYLDELPLSGAEFCLCGSKAMVTDVRHLLQSKGVPEESIYFEGY